MAIPSWLEKKISKEQIKDVENAVKEAEKVTSGEIVPVILKKSSTTGHVPFLMFFLLTTFLLMSVSFLDENFLQTDLMTYASIAILYIASFFLARLELFQRLFTSKEDQKQQVEQRALLEFYESNIQKTEGKTGILLFLSLMERQAVVLADESISKKLPAETWQEVVDLITKGTKEKNLAEGFAQAIQKSGELLSEHFPIQEGDVNELPNQLIIKEY